MTRRDDTYRMLGNLIKTARKGAKLSQPELARLCGWESQSRVSNYERGIREPTLADLRRIAVAVGVDVSYFVRPQADSSTQAGDNAASCAGMVIVNRVSGARLAPDGNVVFDQEEPDTTYAFCPDWIRKAGLDRSRLKTAIFDGHSMSPTLEHGDTVLVNLDERAVRSGRIYAILVDHECRIRRLFRRADGSIEVRSDNQLPQFPTEILNPIAAPDFRIIGRVIWRGGDM